MKRISNLLKKERRGYLAFIKEDYLIGEFLMALLVIVASILFPLFSQAQKAKDGSYSYSPGSSTTVIANKYSALASSVSSGATSVTVSSIAQLAGSYSFTNSVNAFANDALEPGDLVMIIQVQGASITTTDNSSYGAITAYNNTGNYELRTVSSVSSNTISFCVGLTYSYTQSGTARSQVVRIPRFNDITIGTNLIVAAKAWDGTSGGVCSMEIDGALVLNGAVSASGTGFRGGTDPDINNTSTAGGAAVTLYRTTATNTGAGKGESIAGNITDYASMNGANGRGAPANGGGGGNGHNAGGGGGANASNSTSSSWNGTGIKPSGYSTAWNLESASFATNLSWGGGRGGYSYGANDQNAATVAPSNTGWGGDNRQNVGGFGGHPLDFNSNTRTFMGGGGGAGDGNNAHPGDGGAGGGIVYLLITGSVTGTGSIVASGANGEDATGTDDAPGGGGGGGSVIVLSNSTIAGITITAAGGAGGNQPSGSATESEGPGGGGGGGYVLSTTTVVTVSVAGGNNGTTGSGAVTEFPPNGATKGDAGTKLTTGTFILINDCFKEINGLSTPSCTNGSGSIVASGTIINSYYSSTTSVSAGAIRIPIDSIRIGGSSTPVSPGDLLMVIQMQGSTINYTNTSAYGSNTASYAGYLTTVAGTFEYVYAASGFTGSYIYLTTPLKNSYTYSAASGTAGRYCYQVVRVPHYSSLNIAASASITVAEWNGRTGGIIAANVSGTMTLNGGTAITAATLGFRGGGGRQLSGGSGATTDAVTISTNNANGSKGEGIAGTPKYTRSLANTLVDNGVEGYPSGSYAQGAPGNAGGGGTDGNIGNNDENVGGGGGGNGGAGGRGGRAWNDPAQYGGYGGSVFSQASNTRLVMGGGGGAGTTNNGTGPTGSAGFSSSGGSGGGMVFLKVAAVSGSGTINADGATGLSVDNDGAGAGGAGGSVYLYSTNTAGLANVTIYARGGGGGSAWASVADAGAVNDGNPEHGPGGGGGGGVIYTNGTINASSSVAGGTAGITTLSNLNYGAVAGSTGIKLTSATDPITVVKTYCDIDDDNDGIADIVENPSSTVDPFNDADNDGIPNVYDATSGTSVAWVDADFDEINDNYDKDKDGIINELDLDSDNDGIADVVESYGVDTNGDGVIDNYTDANADGLSDNAAATSATLGIGSADFDGDGIPNYLDLDSDGDGIPDVIEVQGTDSNNDGLADSFTDADFDGFNDNLVGSTNALLKSGTDAGSDGLADSWPNKNQDLMGKPNPYDLDSDGDGILDMIEAGISGTNGIASGTDPNLDGWSDTVDALGSLTIPNTDSRGLSNPYDIDSDDDGITDNVEAQATSSYKLPSDTDSDNDGISDVYETAGQIGTYGGGGLTAYDKDSDGTPDYKDTDTDNDGVQDYIEGYGFGSTMYGVSYASLNFTDTDGDGLVDQFDNTSITSLTAGNYYKNVGHSKMGATGTVGGGPTPSGSYAQLPQSSWNATSDRDWRSNTILPLNIVNFTVNYQEPIANIKWEVTNELQASHYEVEMSLNGVDFVQIQKVAAKNIGTSSYAYPYSLANQPTGTFYFRLKQVDKDNKVYYTHIATVKTSKNNAITVGPNPFRSFINISYPSSLYDRITARIVAIDGKVVATKQFNVSKGTNSLQFDNLSGLQKAVYYLVIQSANGQQQVQLLKD
jgi:hypothetical protein